MFASACSGKGSETDQAGTIGSTAGGARAAGSRSITPAAEYEKRATRSPGPPASNPTRPGSTGRFSSETTSVGSSRSPTYTSARDPEKATRILNQLPTGNTTGLQKPSPW